jgi:hypothetical protein
MKTADPLRPDKEFNMLSLKDLIEARDHYHVHLMHKENVVATAVGRYRIRSTDPWPSGKPEEGHATKWAKPHGKGPRTLVNSEIRPYSWACVLVFVDKWVPADHFRPNYGYQPDDAVPRALYMPDGRVVPVCVIEAPRDESAPGPVRNLSFPENLIGGGYPVLVEVQGERHVASIGCLVTDGHLVYALTNRHVVGEPGTPVYTIAGGRQERVGTASAKQLSRLPFQEVYADWPGKNVYVNMDIGLIEVEDKGRWTAQIFGIGTMGELADLSIDNLSLRLIGCPVRGFGCASREMLGEIHGLFYRFKSVGGFEYVSDFLIGARKDGAFQTHPGDSGTLWLLERGEVEAPSEGDGRPAKSRKPAGKEEKKPLLMPIAVQWGGHVFVDERGKGDLQFALATCLSTVCNRLDVDPIRDWNIGLPEYWGAVGHYTIANKACDAIANKNLRELMQSNLERITFPQGAITKKNLSGLSKQDFIPLADVPDLAWKLGPFNRGQKEHPNHFADMDKPNTKDGGTTLLEICKGHPENVSVAVWQKYYTDVEDESRGLLPFRVWQFYQAMVEFVAAGKAVEFVCAAGILSHYVGDACQPLHISYMFNGDPDDTEVVTHKNRQGRMVTEPVPRAAGVHAAYEDGMVDTHTPEILDGVDTLLGKSAKLPAVAGGHDAAVAVVDLMQKTFDTINPKDIVDAFLAVKDQEPRAISDELWSKFGDDTIAVIADGSRYLAHLWNSAWEQGDGDHTIKDHDAIDTQALIDLYSDRTFLPSHTLDEIGPLLDGAAGGGAAPKGRRRRTARAGARS